jgi:Transmembrane domain of unknown function (DUF3566)
VIGGSAPASNGVSKVVQIDERLDSVPDTVSLENVHEATPGITDARVGPDDRTAPDERTVTTRPSPRAVAPSSASVLPPVLHSTGVIPVVQAGGGDASAALVVPPSQLRTGEQTRTPRPTQVPRPLPEDRERPIGFVPTPAPARMRSFQPIVVRRKRPRVRRVRRIVRSIDTWTVFKVSALFYLCAYVVCVIAGVLLWNLAYSTGTVDNVERFFESFGWETFEFKGGEIFHAGWIIGLFLVVAGTGLNVTLATFFNLITDLVGGVGVTVLEEEVRVVRADGDPLPDESRLRLPTRVERAAAPTPSTTPTEPPERQPVADPLGPDAWADITGGTPRRTD